MQDNIQNTYVPTPVITGDTTLPPKVIQLKFHTAYSNPNDDDIVDFDFIVLDLIYSKQDKADRSPALQFLIRVENLSNNVSKNYIQYANDIPYQYWQRTTEKVLNEFDDTPIENGVVNARVTITPINEKGQGKGSTFILPMFDLKYIVGHTSMQNPTLNILAKFWHLYSMTSEDVYNRPTNMHIYIDVPDEDIILDKELLMHDDYRYNALGDFKEINQEMFRWVIQDSNKWTRLNASNEFIDMTDDERKFITYILDSIKGIQRKYLTDNNKSGSDPFRLKVAVENPRDKTDSIVLYIMKGQRWEM